MNEQTITLLSGLVALLSALFTGILAVRKTQADKDNALALSDRQQNVELTKNLQKQNQDQEQRITKLTTQMEAMQKMNSDLMVKVTYLETDKRVWDSERATWHKERMLFEEERREWQEEKNKLVQKIHTMEQQIRKLEGNSYNDNNYS